MTDDFQHGCACDLRNKGFSGFLSINRLRDQLSCIPGKPGDIGVYVVLCKPMTQPQYEAKGSGGYFKGRDPNVDICVLEKHWVKNAEILYIGKAGRSGQNSTIRSRLQAYLAFGNEKRVAHWGGRFIWQLKDHEDLLICWKLVTSSTPRELEKEMIQDFKHKYGARPFANLRD